MKAMVYTQTGDPDVLRLVERSIPSPGPGEVRIRVAFSAVNPTDTKSRAGSAPGQPTPFPQVPNQDGSGVIDAVGADVDPARIGQRVWVWESAYQRPEGTAQQFTTVTAAQAVPLPDDVALRCGAQIGIPFMTAHRALTCGENVPDQLSPGSLSERSVLIAGGAGSVGNAAIQLARWAGARVITTVSSPLKAQSARAAGADVIVDYRAEDAVAAVRAAAPDGVDVIVEVAPRANAELDIAVVAAHATVAVYADDGQLSLPVRALMMPNACWQFILVYTEPAAAKSQGLRDISAALRAGAIRFGIEAGLPAHEFELSDTASAHQAVADGIVGRAVIKLAEPS
jgi:NADPH2:quinone reductase